MASEGFSVNFVSSFQSQSRKIFLSSSVAAEVDQKSWGVFKGKEFLSNQNFRSQDSCQLIGQFAAF